MKKLLTLLAVAALAVLTLSSCHKVNTTLTATVSTLGANIDRNVATMSGKLSLSGGTRQDLNYVEVGIRYSTVEGMSSYEEVIATNLDDKFEFSVTVSGLEYGTPHYFCAYVKYGGNVHCGNIQTFTPEIMVGM